MPVYGQPIDAFPQPSFTAAYVRDMVNNLLGGQSVEIELNDTDHATFLRMAVTRYNQAIPRRSKHRVQAPQGASHHTLDHPRFTGIVDVQFTPLTDNPAVGLLDAADSTTLPLLSGSFDTFGSLEQSIGYLETARRIGSQDPEWDLSTDADGNPTLSITVPTPMNVQYVYTWAMTADDNANTGLRWVSPLDQEWIINYCLSQAKQTLGRKLRKHGGIPTPDGGTDSTDGESLVNEGREDQQRLEEELQRRRRPLPPVFG